ncbi:MAG: CinA family protein [Lachnospiraceae bacterium]|jgi:PncC family amidohydrolase|nr:CinA family protein [Lachnospiraceae bacterium]MCR4802732.1 CinA family protein [Lachnospiraceae bacterium]
MSVAEQFVNRLIELDYQVSCAESCTGGKLTGAIVDVANASKVLNASIVTYSNEAKKHYLHVSDDTLSKYGAVSEQTAYEMAEGIAKANHANIGLSITGTAGPDGGTKEKPVGTVCFGFSINGKVSTKKKQFGNLGRNQVRDASVEYALSHALELLDK